MKKLEDRLTHEIKKELVKAGFKVVRKAWQHKDGSWWTHDKTTGKVVPYKGKTAKPSAGAGAGEAKPKSPAKEKKPRTTEKHISDVVAGVRDNLPKYKKLPDPVIVSTAKQIADNNGIPMRDFLSNMDAHHIKNQFLPELDKKLKTYKPSTSKNASDLAQDISNSKEEHKQNLQHINNMLKEGWETKEQLQYATPKQLKQIIASYKLHQAYRNKLKNKG